MNTFTYSYPVKVYFGEKAAEKNLAAELAEVGPNVMLAYGGILVKKRRRKTWLPNLPRLGRTSCSLMAAVPSKRTASMKN